jgi:NifU-like protein involved in Fe-S cluster formation
MSDELYQKELMRLAAEATGAGRLKGAAASATVHNPLCGDRVTMDARIERDRLLAVGHEVKACLLCQAAASVIGAQAPGKTRHEIAATAQAVEAFIKTGAELPPASWPGLDLFAPVRPHKSRHRCVLLPFEALLAALAKAPG